MDDKSKAIPFFCNPFFELLYVVPIYKSKLNFIIFDSWYLSKVLCLGHYIASVQMLYIKFISQVLLTDQNMYFIKYRHVKRLVNTRVCKSYLSMCIVGSRLYITSSFGPRP